MTFSKCKNQTLPDMVSIFWKQLNECKSALMNNNGSIPNLHQKIDALDFQIKRIEKALNNAPVDKKNQYSYLYQNANSEYIKFKQKHSDEIEAYINEQNVARAKESRQQMIEQTMEEQEAENLEYLANEVQSISRQMKEINEISNYVINELQSQRHQIVKIDSLTSKAVDHMEKGNIQLEKAEKNQRTCNIC